jgi:hypothetical protein
MCNTREELKVVSLLLALHDFLRPMAGIRAKRSISLSTGQEEGAWESIS